MIASDQIHMVSVILVGLLGAVACGAGVLPLFTPRLKRWESVWNGNAFASGLMLSTSIHSLLVPIWTYSSQRGDLLSDLLMTSMGLAGGCLMIRCLDAGLGRNKTTLNSQTPHGRTALLLFLAMTIHSAPEGIAVGAGYASEIYDPLFHGLGYSLGLAIAVHNVPEGLIVAIPMRAQGFGFGSCFSAAFFSSLPQPLLAAPACLAICTYETLLLPSLSVAAGAMIYLIFAELLPTAARQSDWRTNLLSFAIGSASVVLLQIIV